jgi:hypothetical protein
VTVRDSHIVSDRTRGETTVHVVWPETVTRALGTGSPVSVIVTVPEIDDVPTGMWRSLGWGAGVSLMTTPDLTPTCAPTTAPRHIVQTANTGQPHPVRNPILRPKRRLIRLDPNFALLDSGAFWDLER